MKRQLHGRGKTTACATLNQQRKGRVHVHGVHVTLTETELASFRTKLCEGHQRSSCMESDGCPNSHCLTWQRRCPFDIPYSPKLCPDIHFVKKGSKMSLVRRCNRGRQCLHAHSKEEELYHPLMYKTKTCSSFPSCKRCYCPFAHSSEELRQPLSNPLLKAFWKECFEGVAEGDVSNKEGAASSGISKGDVSGELGVLPRVENRSVSYEKSTLIKVTDGASAASFPSLVNEKRTHDCGILPVVNRSLSLQDSADSFPHCSAPIPPPPPTTDCDLQAVRKHVDTVGGCRCAVRSSTLAAPKVRYADSTSDAELVLASYTAGSRVPSATVWNDSVRSRTMPPSLLSPEVLYQVTRFNDDTPPNHCDVKKCKPTHAESTVEALRTNLKISHPQLTSEQADLVVELSVVLAKSISSGSPHIASTGGSDAPHTLDSLATCSFPTQWEKDLPKVEVFSPPQTSSEDSPLSNDAIPYDPTCSYSRISLAARRLCQQGGQSLVTATPSSATTRAPTPIHHALSVSEEERSPHQSQTGGRGCWDHNLSMKSADDFSPSPDPLRRKRGATLPSQPVSAYCAGYWQRSSVLHYGDDYSGDSVLCGGDTSTLFGKPQEIMVNDLKQVPTMLGDRSPTASTVSCVVADTFSHVSSPRVNPTSPPSQFDFMDLSASSKSTSEAGGSNTASVSGASGFSGLDAVLKSRYSFNPPLAERFSGPVADFRCAARHASVPCQSHSVAAQQRDGRVVGGSTLLYPKSDVRSLAKDLSDSIAMRLQDVELLSGVSTDGDDYENLWQEIHFQRSSCYGTIPH